MSRSCDGIKDERRRRKIMMMKRKRKRTKKKIEKRMKRHENNERPLRTFQREKLDECSLDPSLKHLKI